MALLAGGGSAQLVRSVGSAGSVQGFQADGELVGARLSAALPFTAQLQAQDGIAQQAQGAAGITGNLAATETGADTAALAGVVLVQGALAASEAGADSFSAEGVVRVAGTLAATETGADTFAATGGTSSSITGTLAATETGADTFSAEGIVKVQGTLAATESGADTFAADGDTVFFTISGRQALRLLQIHLLHGLDVTAPLTVSPTARQAGAVAQTVAEAGGTVTITTTAGATVFAGDPGQMIDELAALHGLTAPLTVTAASRAAGSISQAIATAGDTTTVTRAA